MEMRLRSRESSWRPSEDFDYSLTQGLLRDDSSKIHAGILTTLSGSSDYDDDGYYGLKMVGTPVIDVIGTQGMAQKILDRVGTTQPLPKHRHAEPGTQESYRLILFVVRSDAFVSCGGKLASVSYCPLR